jgi:hypothetical protein
MALNKNEWYLSGTGKQIAAIRSVKSHHATHQIIMSIGDSSSKGW